MILCRLFFVLPLLVSAAQALDFPSTPATPPERAAESFQVMEGFTMDLLAAEPLVTDPVSITYDADGRAYVCEMVDYPYTGKAQHRPSQENPTDQAIGRVRLLVDSDGDGDFDKSTVFADGLSWPTGAACWKGGVFVTATPDIWYLRDTNGDGVADLRQRVFTGFKKLNVQAVMNNPIWRPDHHIYVAGGSNGGVIERVAGSEVVMPIPAGSQPIPLRRSDFSFDPATGETRLESGGARFGQAMDDWGNRFLCNIRNPCQQVVLPYRFLQEHPEVMLHSPLHDAAVAGDQLPVYRTSPVEPWREFRAKRWSAEGSTLPRSELVGAGVVTSSAGITVYRGDAYPPEFRQFAFVADVAGNLFYRMKLQAEGVVYRAEQVDKRKNFCTSRDLWFRPVNFTNAPDGTLHVCDMYREVIEHPWSIPDDIHGSLDLLNGTTKGRLWRLAPPGFQPRAAPALSKADTLELVGLLDHPNAWHRDTAQRLLYERNDATAHPALRRLVCQGHTAQGRISALWGLWAQMAGSEDFYHMVASALADDPAQEVRRAAAELAWMEMQGKTPTPVLLQEAVLEVLARMPADETPTLPLMMALAEIKDESVLREPLRKLAGKASADPWLTPILVALALRGDPTALATSLDHAGGAAPVIFLETLAEAIATKGTPVQWTVALQAVPSLAEDRPRQAFLTGLVAGGFLRGSRLSKTGINDAAVQWWRERGEKAKAKVTSMEPATEERIAALKLLWFTDTEQTMLLLPELLGPSTPSDLQLAVLTGLNTRKDDSVAELLLKAWSGLTPAVREKAATVLLARRERISRLLDAVERGQVTSAQLSAATKASLARQTDPVLARRIADLLSSKGQGSRQDIVARYLREMPKSADVKNGAQVYQKACMACHRHGEQGSSIGPHLGNIRAWTPEQIVVNILDPNREVSPNFAMYVIETLSGRTVTGLIGDETAGSLTLRQAEGSSEVIHRSEIKSLTTPGISLMPEGLEAVINPQDMADLIRFLTGS